MPSLWVVWRQSGFDRAYAPTDSGQRYSLLFALLGSVGVISARFLFHQQSTVISYTFFAIGFTGLLGFALTSGTEDTLLGCFLNARWLRYTGKISYGLYLTHMPIFTTSTAIAKKYSPISRSSIPVNLTGAVLQISAAFLIASISWRACLRHRYCVSSRILLLIPNVPSRKEM